MKIKNRFHHDFETFSEVDLRKTGSAVYSEHSSTDVLMLAYRFDSGPVRQWVPVEGQAMPAEVEDAMFDDRVTKFAWNAAFERNIWKNCLGVSTPLSSWRDPMVMALACALPGKLDSAGKVMGLGEEFLKKDGTRLINWFSKLRPATKTKPARRVHWHEKPDLWDKYKEYNVYDVLAEAKIYLNLSPYDMPQEEWDLWYLDQEINDNGIPVSLETTFAAIKIRDHIKEDLANQFRDLTGIASPSQVAELLSWARKRGYPFTDLKAGHIRRAVDKLEATEPNSEVVRALRIRLDFSKSSTAKYDAFARATSRDGRLRGAHQMDGAGTGRWAGRMIQAQNLPRAPGEFSKIEFELQGNSRVKKVVGGPYISTIQHIRNQEPEDFVQIHKDPLAVLSGAIRPTIEAPEGKLFLDADWAAIENVLLGWTSGDKKILRVFKENRDPYVDFGTFLFKETYDKLYSEYKSGDKSKRTIAKPGVLGCGYMLGAGKQYEDRRSGEIEATGLLGYAWNMGVKLTPEQAETSVRVWRETYTDAVDFWYALERAARKCVRTGKPTNVRSIGFDKKGPFLRMILPSGRALYYCRPRIEPWLMPWGDYKDSITYETVNDRKQWDRVSTHPGKLTENAVQALARDILATGLKRAKRMRFEITLHVHDQILALEDEAAAPVGLQDLLGLMAEPPEWAPDLPLRAEGHISKWFIKD